MSETAPLLQDACRHLGQEDLQRPTPASLEEKPTKISGLPLMNAMLFPCLGMLLTGMDRTIATVTSATMVSEFQWVSLIPWMGTTYLAASCAAQTMTGKLSDIYGRRSTLMFALLLFGLGILICAIAEDASIVILGRIVAGFGSGAVGSLTIIIGTDLAFLRHRGLVQGMTSLSFAFGSGLGGVSGGVINDLRGWRWAFWSILPALFLVALGNYLTLNDKQSANSASLKEKLKRIDFVGVIVLISALAVLIIGLTSDASATTARTAVALPVSVALLIVFGYIESYYASEPIVDFALFRNSNVVFPCLVFFFLMATIQTLEFYVPLSLQLNGHSTSTVGLQTLISGLGNSLGSIGTGIGMHLLSGYGILNPIALSFIMVSPAGFSATTAKITPLWAAALFLWFQGSCYGSTLTIQLVAMLATIDSNLQAIATSTLLACRNAGGAVGLATAGFLLRRKLDKNVAELIPVGSDGKIVDMCNGMTDANEPEICEAYRRALQPVFVLTLAFASVAVVAGLLIKNVDLLASPTEGDIKSEHRRAVSDEENEQRGVQ